MTSEAMSPLHLANHLTDLLSHPDQEPATLDPPKGSHHPRASATARDSDTKHANHIPTSTAQLEVREAHSPPHSPRGHQPTLLHSSSMSERSSSIEKQTMINIRDQLSRDLLSYNHRPPMIATIDPPPRGVLLVDGERPEASSGTHAYKYSHHATTSHITSTNQGTFLAPLRTKRSRLQWHHLHRYSETSYLIPSRRAPPSWHRRRGLGHHLLPSSLLDTINFTIPAYIPHQLSHKQMNRLTHIMHGNGMLNYFTPRPGPAPPPPPLATPSPTPPTTLRSSITSYFTRQPGPAPPPPPKRKVYAHRTGGPPTHPVTPNTTTTLHDSEPLPPPSPGPPRLRHGSNPLI